MQTGRVFDTGRLVWKPLSKGNIGWALWRVASITGLWLLCASSVSAQTPIVIGPTSTLQWDMDSIPAPTAQAFTYVLSVDGTPLPAPNTPLPNVTCVTVTQTTCRVLASVVPSGSHSLTMTAGSGSLTSLPSTPFTYLTVIIPVPQGLRFVP